MSIANRILLGFACSVLLLVALGTYGLSQIAAVRDTTEAIVSRDLAAYKQIDVVRDSANLMSWLREATASDFLIRSLGRGQPAGADRVADWTRQAAATEAALASAQATVGRFAESAIDPARAQAWRGISQLMLHAAEVLRLYREQTEAQFRAIRANDMDAVLAAEPGLAAERVEFARLMTESQDALDQGTVAGQRHAAQVYEESRVSILLALAMAVTIGIIVTYLVRRSILRPLDTFTAFVRRVGQGDLTGEAATGEDEFGRLGDTLNRMVEGLRLLARQSRETTETLNAAAAEIRASTQQQAASLEEQLAAVQETAATADEITHAGAQIGRRAQEVIASAQVTAQTSADGLHAVEETARAMDLIREQAEAVAGTIVALSEKTQAIGEIIATVNDLSERSHLLALNAAIEAAAAGEAGRSFAVVAAEMKMLADQAKEATAQVRAILGDIQRGINASVLLTEEAVKRVAAGKARTDTTQRTITEITGRIQEGVQTFQQIVASTNQQQLGMEQVKGALRNIRQASQQTAAGTRELDMAAGNLAGLAQQLLALAERYRT